jgi:hypothetical protein
MSSLIPGVHVAEILHTAAWMDFSNYVRSLLQLGRVAEARCLWESVVGVIHNGTNPNLQVLGIPELPGVLRAPCMESPYVRCDARRGGFRFPFVGIWAKTSVLAQTREGPQTVWDRYHGCEEIFELLAAQSF